VRHVLVLRRGVPGPLHRRLVHNPTPEFIAALPKDPAALLAKLREEGRADDTGAFMQALEALRSGQYPAEGRANLFRALALLPGLVVTDKRANLDGKEGDALGKKYYDDFTEIIIDPDNGDFIGTREVIAEDQTGDKGSLKKGAVRQTSAVTSAVVGSLGARPKVLQPWSCTSSSDVQLWGCTYWRMWGVVS
jgi:hypothetical protein